MMRVRVLLIILAMVVAMIGCDNASSGQFSLTILVDPPGSGTALDVTDSSPYAAGGSVSIKAEAAEGYEFGCWTASAGLLADESAAETTFTMPAQNVTITASFLAGRAIRTWHDLDAIRDDLDGTYILMNNLDSTTAGYDELAGQTANAGKGWQPIGGVELDPATGDFTGVDAFTGSFDGNGYEIRDLFIDRALDDGVALFGSIDGAATIGDVRIVGTAVTGNMACGALVGWNGATLNGSYANGSVIGELGVGGLVGVNSGTVSSSCSSGIVGGRDAVGGLVGYNDHGATIDMCRSTGDVTGTAWDAGGLVGANDGIVSNSFFNGDVTGNEIVGGLVGFNQGSITDSYAEGSTTGNTSVGGLVGLNREGTVENSLSTCKVVGTELAGGLIGENWGIVSNSFWDIDASEMEGSDAGTGKTTIQMMRIATFTDTATEGLDDPWDMTAVADPNTRDRHSTWNIVNGSTYPFLSWQPVS